MTTIDFQAIESVKPSILKLRKKDFIFFDLGANINKTKKDFQLDCTSLFLDIFGEHLIKQIYAFEPLHYQRFEEIYGKHDKVSLVKMAVDTESGNKTMYQPPPHGLSSFYDREVFKTIRQNGEQIIEHNVKCISLDEFVAKNKVDYIDFLKIDVEGAELRVLQGAKNCLAQKLITGGSFEFGGTFKDAGISIGDVRDFLKKYNYKFGQKYLNCYTFLQKDL